MSLLQFTLTAGFQNTNVKKWQEINIKTCKGLRRRPLTDIGKCPFKRNVADTKPFGLPRFYSKNSKGEILCLEILRLLVLCAFNPCQDHLLFPPARNSHCFHIAWYWLVPTCGLENEFNTPWDLLTIKISLYRPIKLSGIFFSCRGMFIRLTFLIYFWIPSTP